MHGVVGAEIPISAHVRGRLRRRFPAGPNAAGGAPPAASASAPDPAGEPLSSHSSKAPFDKWLIAKMVRQSGYSMNEMV